MTKVLLVEDDPILRELLLDYLGDFDITLDTASDGEDALRRFEISDYAMVISDLFMPKMDGLAFIQKLRELDAHIPVVVVTASTQPEAKQQLKNLNITALYYKPLSADDIDKLIERIQS